MNGESLWCNVHLQIDEESLPSRAFGRHPRSGVSGAHAHAHGETGGLALGRFG